MKYFSRNCFYDYVPPIQRYTTAVSRSGHWSVGECHQEVASLCMKWRRLEMEMFSENSHFTKWWCWYISERWVVPYSCSNLNTFRPTLILISVVSDSRQHLIRILFSVLTTNPGAGKKRATQNIRTYLVRDKNCLVQPSKRIRLLEILK